VAAIAGAILAAALWVLVFRVHRLSLWNRSWLAAAVLIGYAITALAVIGRLDRVLGAVSPLEVGLGLAAGAASVVATHIGSRILRRLAPAFSRQLGGLYGMAGGTPLEIAGPLLAMAVAEELLFRGVVQGELGLLVALGLYVAVQLVTGQWGLLIAAAFGGLLWGGLVSWRDGLVAAVVAHAVWTSVLVLVWPLAPVSADAGTGTPTPSR
jgi:membrane protease YdiL (CAAX protease family)